MCYYALLRTMEILTKMSEIFRTKSPMIIFRKLPQIHQWKQWERLLQYK